MHGVYYSTNRLSIAVSERVGAAWDGGRLHGSEQRHEQWECDPNEGIIESVEEQLSQEDVDVVAQYADVEVVDRQLGHGAVLFASAECAPVAGQSLQSIVDASIIAARNVRSAQ